MPPMKKAAAAVRRTQSLPSAGAFLEWVLDDADPSARASSNARRRSRCWSCCSGCSEAATAGWRWRSVTGVSDPDAPEPNPFATCGEDVMRRRASLKWRTYDPDVLPLWVAEMDADPAPVIVEAVERAIHNGETGYPYGSALRDAFVGFAADRWAWRVDPESVVEVADVLSGLTQALGLVTGPGDPVIINTPVWPPFADLIGTSAGPWCRRRSRTNGRLDFATLEEALDRSTYRGGRAALLLCSPHNPTGAVHTAAELARVAELAGRFGVRVVVDEVHAPLCYPESRFVPYLTVPGGESGITVISAAKAWNIAGLKAALLIPGSAARADTARLPDLVRYGTSAIGMVAHAAAFAGGGPWLDAHLAGLEQNRDQVANLLGRWLPGVGFRPPEATYFAWLDCRALDLDPDPTTVFLEQGRVALSGGETFVAGGDGFVRLNFAAAPATLDAAVRRMAAVSRPTG